MGSTNLLTRVISFMLLEIFYAYDGKLCMFKSLLIAVS